MWKVSFTPLLFSIALALIGLTNPQGARARDGEMPSAVGDIAKTLTPRQLHRVAKHARSRNNRRLVARQQEAPLPAGPASLTTQPDIAAPEKPLPFVELPDKAKESDAKKNHEGAAKSKIAAIEPLPHEIRQFCANTASVAVDARVAWQAARLIELEARLRQRIAEFEVKRAEFEDWLHKHDEAMQEAKDDIVAIYSRMPPEAAASQLAVMNDVMAASLLAKLNSRVASAILAEMDPGRAARIANAMVGPVSSTDGKKS